MSHDTRSAGGGRMLEAILCELDALSAELLPGGGVSEEIISALARATDRLDAWSDAIEPRTDDEASGWQAGLGCSASQLARLREQLTLEEERLAGLTALAEQQRQQVRELRSSIAAAQPSLDDAPAAGDDEDRELLREEEALLQQERTLYAEMARLVLRAEAEHRSRVAELQRENTTLAGGDRSLIANAEQLAALFEGLSPMIPDLERRGVAGATTELGRLLEGVTAERDAAAARFDEHLALDAELSGLARRLDWVQGELSAGERWRRLLGDLEAPLAEEERRLEEERLQLSASTWSPVDADRIAESEWIAGEIVGRTIFLELHGDWIQEAIEAAELAAAERVAVEASVSGEER